MIFVWWYNINDLLLNADAPKMIKMPICIIFLLSMVKAAQ